jgi:hypothetical protein
MPRLGRSASKSRPTGVIKSDAQFSGLGMAGRWRKRPCLRQRRPCDVALSRELCAPDCRPSVPSPPSARKVVTQTCHSLFENEEIQDEARQSVCAENVLIMLAWMTTEAVR